MRLTELFGIQLPIIQAPMAGSQNHKLALAVAQAGGLGSIPCAMLSTAAMYDEMQAFRQQSSATLNVNFFCHTPPTPQESALAQWRSLLAPYYEEFGIAPNTTSNSTARTPFSSEALAVLQQCKPQIVSFHFGLPAQDLLDEVRALGIKIISNATTVAEALWLEQRGVDAIIAQGLEAGGHRGMFLSDDLTTQLGTFALVPQIVRAVSCPVIVAGGIADADGVQAALALGASAVQVGSAYLFCPEAATSAVHRAALASSAAQHTALTNLFSGRSARGIMNRLMRELGPLHPQAPAFPLAAGAIAPLRAHAEQAGSGDFSPLWAGQNISACRAIPAAHLTQELAGRNT
ncbi:MAG: nitronate monooxygenase [Burkholderiales bacterium]|nr:nitronate monooxygenase [Burkholderiales bacterium]